MEDGNTITSEGINVAHPSVPHNEAVNMLCSIYSQPCTIPNDSGEMHKHTAATIILDTTWRSFNLQDAMHRRNPIWWIRREGCRRVPGR